ncbi:enoyl-CoA hydratase-related protein [Tropicimonas isoalkanivorans]|uniref:2-(1,2-epoxy-1,2-dihydrophenyl)acetyl-CoA isomerase n=1 Tax=Tropicimonas isoalkanivorans TaxID=441112 RepID=A0A1I1I3Q2_9RHOB|nr:enoyl-CoA hydratase-related protein [Tropicimonas isoalkanivorans]SFC28303.1 2-(1,2-epoxy-1,2-dihydrophenyl)acetyl-CoA isomerase [Tropicimonas isoalkanivorans]
MADLEIGITKDGICRITLNRPDALNAVTDEMFDTLAVELPKIGRDAAVRVVLLGSVGRGFCAGADVKGMKGNASSMPFETRVETLRRRQEAVVALHEMPKVTIARIQGVAAGAGMALAIACDLRVAAPQASFTTAFAKVGFAGDFGITYLLARIIGPDRAQRLLLTSEKLGARDALAIGLVTHLVEGDLTAEADAISAGLASGPVLAHGYIKANIREVESGNFRASLDAEAFRQIRLATSEDHTEAIRAFAEKRPPVFRGR